MASGAGTRTWWKRGWALVPALAAATTGGWVFTWLGVPLGWMLGSMTACMVITISGGHLVSPRKLRPPMAVLLGLAIGAGFQPQMLAQMSQWLISLVLVIPMLGLVSLLGRAYFSRVAGYDRLTALYCAIPGGLSEIVLLAEQTTADVRTIALVHAARIAITISVLSIGVGLFIDLSAVQSADGVSPFVPAAGSFVELGILLGLGILAWRIGKRLSVPAPHMMAPLVLSAVAHMSGWIVVELPAVLVAAAQVVIGAGIGCRFAGTRLAFLGRVFVHGLVFVAIVLSFCLLLAVCLTGWVGQPAPTIVMAFSPGGLTELSLLSLAAGLDAGYVAAHHLVRQLTVVTVAPFLGPRPNR
ncbi:AbrB family transcriptional regulator [Pelagibacterium sp.]|uniref:AbrB family transcriptional regulator n=1 Tax=Pelagibacterium sp. TaxID=1967288 RepID=UPI003BA85754